MIMEDNKPKYKILNVEKHNNGLSFTFIDYTKDPELKRELIMSYEYIFENLVEKR